MNWETALPKVAGLLRMFVDASGLDVQFALAAGAERDGAGLQGTFTGADTGALTARNAELLHALETLTADVLRLAPEDQELISFDADGFKARRMERMQRSAEVGVRSVESTGRPYAFPPMNSRERRMLHLELAKSGLRTASSGETARRFVVLYPAGAADGGANLPDETRASEDRSGDRLRVIRSTFRPR